MQYIILYHKAALLAHTLKASQRGGRIAGACIIDGRIVQSHSSQRRAGVRSFERPFQIRVGGLELFGRGGIAHAAECQFVAQPHGDCGGLHSVYADAALFVRREVLGDDLERLSVITLACTLGSPLMQRGCCVGAALGWGCHADGEQVKQALSL